MIVPTSREIRLAIRDIVAAKKAEIDARLGMVVAGFTASTFWHYFTTNYDTGSMPLFMIEQENESFEFVGQPNLLRGTFRATIWGLVHYDVDAVQDDLVSEYAGAISGILNQRHLPIPVGDFEIYFNDSAPVSNIIYGAQMLQNQVVKGFTASFKADVEACSPDRK